MRRYLQQGSGELVGGKSRTDGATACRLAPRLPLLISVFSIAVYLLTMDRSSSWWDCGEFIATGWLLQVGHPPGAPVYQLLSHLFMLLSFGNPMLVAPMSNALSAVAGGVTVGLLYRIIVQLGARPWAAAVGAFCYLFCDTAWFSAVESEVYSLAMLFCALDIWIALRWRSTRNPRLPLLLALLTGLGACVHLMTLLTLPAVAVAMLCGRHTKQLLRLLPLMAVFFVVGLTPYAIIPLRAAAHPPINEGNPSTAEAFGSYLRRDQYAKAPLYPRLWRERDSANVVEWTGGHDGVAGNALYYVKYQLGYMYGRYFMYNFMGRENLKSHRTVVFILPFLLGLWGLLGHRRRNRQDFWTVMLLFLFGGVLLNFYLNHPCYEPRERDYAYVLSFFAFAVWIGLGADDVMAKGERLKVKGERLKVAVYWVLVGLMLSAPATMAAGNWSDHDRHRCHSVHDISMNHLQSCDRDAVLITFGDNDTFPLWYLQQVEGRRTDVSIYNIGLTGFKATMDVVEANIGRRPVYVTQYFYDRYGWLFDGHLRCEGFCWRVLPTTDGVGDTEPLQRHLREDVKWHITEKEYIDHVSATLLAVWERNTGQRVRTGNR